MATLDSGELTEIDGVNRERAERLREAGYQTIEHVSAASSEQLSEVDGISNALASRIESTTEDIGDSDDDPEEADHSDKSHETENNTPWKYRSARIFFLAGLFSFGGAHTAGGILANPAGALMAVGMMVPLIYIEIRRGMSQATDSTK